MTRFVNGHELYCHATSVSQSSHCLNRLMEQFPVSREAGRRAFGQVIGVARSGHGASDRLARTALPKSPLGDAVRYLTNQWEALQRYVDDGRVAIDNNRAYAAHGISAGMPRARLCRAGEISPQSGRDRTPTLVRDAA